YFPPSSYYSLYSPSFSLSPRPPRSPLFPYTTLFRSPGADMRAHEAGALHGNDAAPTWLPYPQGVNHLIDGLWSRNTSRNAAGAVGIAGVDVHRIAEEVGTPAFVLDEDAFRHRARAFRDAFAQAFEAHRGADVYYAGKAFLCGAVARWVEEDGLGLDVSTGGELAVALRAEFAPERIALHGNNKSEAE